MKVKESAKIVSAFANAEIEYQVIGLFHYSVRFVS